ncbi:hypothetical protein GCM10010329_48920 [Streptomyces spiroverticillatus]|uniref:Uncharacterized protein n=1 Tax=Streptomyces finlayi TaxID=67296 RepID=A0A919CC15_9ACTN|nr:hypothetical protein GCM10010329_48920 [Streptomyces spiroverticillatus]GHD02837.1 hypothetical protein GCM10010334_49870 [Streptomyces finlayi]
MARKALADAPAGAGAAAAADEAVAAWRSPDAVGISARESAIRVSWGHRGHRRSQGCQHLAALNTDCLSRPASKIYLGEGRHSLPPRLWFLM